VCVVCVILCYSVLLCIGEFNIRGCDVSLLEEAVCSKQFAFQIVGANRRLNLYAGV